jgi:dihydrofolate synthase/folylpolyglutamate synthase
MQHGMKVVVQELSKLEYNRLHFVFGVVKDKDIAAMLQLLPLDALLLFLQSQHSQRVRCRRAET